MKILYDHQIFTMQTHGGISNYFVDLIRSLPETVECDIALKYNENIHLKEGNLFNNSSERFVSYEKLRKYHIPFRRPLFKWIEKRKFQYTPSNAGRSASIEKIKKNDFDVFHPTFYDTYFLDYLKRPFVLTVHDLIYEQTKALFNQTDQIEQRKILCPKAAKIIAISQNTAEDLQKYYNIPDSKISVIYQAISGNYNTRRSIPSIFNFKYTLYVGARFSYKNFGWMIENIADYLKNSDLKLVCTGNHFSKAEKSKINKLHINDKVIHIYADKSQMGSLYNNAECFIYPSLYEGFGLPILEAFTNECPMLLSKASCFPEIASDAALYFEIGNKESFIRNLDSVIKNDDLQKQLIERGKERLNFFSLKKRAEQTLEVYKSVL